MSNNKKAWIFHNANFKTDFKKASRDFTQKYLTQIPNSFQLTLMPCVLRDYIAPETFKDLMRQQQHQQQHQQQQQQQQHKHQQQQQHALRQQQESNGVVLRHHKTINKTNDTDTYKTFRISLVFALI